MYRRIIAGALAGATVVLTTIAGCAKVDPQPDYRRAEELTTRSTGQQYLFDPLEREAAERRVEELLRDGLTADEAAQVALLHNPELQAALYEIGAARADLVQSGLLSNPTLGLALRLPSAGGLSNIDFDLAQNIADLWQIPARKRMAARDLDQTILRIARQASAVAAQAKEAFYRASGAARRLAIARENREIGRTIVELTEFRRRAGAGNRLDVNLARGVLLDAELATKRARLAAGSARRALATVLGLAEDAAAVRLTEPLPTPPAHTLQTETLIRLAWAERLDARALRQSVDSARQRLVLEVRRVIPTFEFGLALERDARRRVPGRDLLADTARSSIGAGRLSAPDIQPRSERKRAKGQDVIIGPMVSLELPIFDQNQAQIAKARYELERRLRLLEGLERTIRQEVREAVDQARTAWEVARFYRDEVVPQASRSLELSRESYRAGQSSILSVLDAERSYLAARDRFAEAMQQAAAAGPLLERAVGLPMDRLVEAVRRPASQPAGGSHP